MADCEKVLDIIIRKNVDIWAVKSCETSLGYSFWCGDVRDILTKEEFETVKNTVNTWNGEKKK